jgi:hypothetical protein
MPENTSDSKLFINKYCMNIPYKLLSAKEKEESLVFLFEIIL